MYVIVSTYHWILLYILIVSDNGSIDGTREYLETLDDSRIRIFKQDTNLGIFGNLNFLLKQAKAPIAKILCADDKLLPGALKSIVYFMENHPDCAVSRCWAKGDQQKYHTRRWRYEAMLPLRINSDAAAILVFATFGNVIGNLSCAACRPDMVMSCGGFDQNFPYAGDFEAWIRVGMRFGIYLQKEELVFVRSHKNQNSILLNQNNELYSQFNSILNRLLSLCEPEDRFLLRMHWTMNFFPGQRIARAVRQLLSGKLKLVWQSLTDFPEGISPLLVFLSYSFWKVCSPVTEITSRRLIKRIYELNRR